jgi:hypothetical protein
MYHSVYTVANLELGGIWSDSSDCTIVVAADDGVWCADIVEVFPVCRVLIVSD